jgi:hypothetical protein
VCEYSGWLGLGKKVSDDLLPRTNTARATELPERGMKELGQALAIATGAGLMQLALELPQDLQHRHAA